MLPLNPHSHDALLSHGVPLPVVRVAMAMLEEIIAAGDDTVRDTGIESFDDAVSKGQLHYWRARNRIIARFAGNRFVTCDETDNAFQVHIQGVKISFYSARNGIDNPSVEGSPTKKRVVNEFQLMLDVDDPREVTQLVLIHERGDDGVTRAALGVLSSASAWAWHVTVYDRFATVEAADAAARSESYDQLPEPKLPPMKKREADESSRRNL